ncbi:MAG: hypothetical protein O7F73_09760 [Gammaproteobacteria bacterium]|nr:hypothetical protein [Gammaproteobacteria bacterium]
MSGKHILITGASGGIGQASAQMRADAAAARQLWDISEQLCGFKYAI